MRSKLQTTVYNVGCVGYGPWKVSVKGVHTKEYGVWKSMLSRCYSEAYQKNKKTYKDCTVDERWHNFQNFCEDIKELEGYQKWKENTKPFGYHLDKDTIKPGNKKYTKELCMFLTGRANSAEMNLRREKARECAPNYLGIRILDGYQEYFGTPKKFEKKYNIPSVHTVIQNKGRSSGGWVFLRNPIPGSIVPVKHFKGTLGGLTEEFLEIKGFANKHRLDPSAVSRCLKGKAHSHKGWVFSVIILEVYISKKM